MSYYGFVDETHRDSTPPSDPPEPPPVTPEMLEAARRRAGGYLYVVDPAYDPDGDVPKHATRGAFKVDEDGEIGDYHANPDHRPIDLSRPPVSPVDHGLREVVAGRLGKDEFRKLVAEATLPVLVSPDKQPMLLDGDGGSCLVAFTGQDVATLDVPTEPMSLCELLRELPPDASVELNGSSELRTSLRTEDLLTVLDERKSPMDSPENSPAAVPTLIGVYSMASRGEPQRVAEFRWSPESGVTVNVLDEEWGSVALSFYNRGVPLIAEQRDVQASEGPEFMRALLTRKHMSYYGFVDESAQDEPASRDTEGDMSEPQGLQLTALEQAISRYAAEQGPVEDVYREFLVADLLLVTGPDSSPAFFQIEGFPKEQIFVCTHESAVPNVGMPGAETGVRRVTGYRLLSMLVERNVRILTQGDLMDLMIIGSRAIEISAPEITDGMRAEAARNPGTWVSVADRMYSQAAPETIPEYGWIGAYWAEEDGTLSGRYRLNPDYRPSPVTLGFPQPESFLEKILHLWAAGHVSDRDMHVTVAQSEVTMIAHEDGVPSSFNLDGKQVFIVGSSPKYIPDTEWKIEAAVARFKPVFDEVDLIIDYRTRHQVRIEGKALIGVMEELQAEDSPQGGETGSTPAGQAAPQQPQQPAPPPQPVDAHERFMGSMLAGAVGDALGYAIEFHDIDMIRRNHGDAGLVTPVLRDGVAQISDDTQMMLFTLEGLIRAHIARRIKPVDNDPVPEVQHAYQRWFHTQNQPWQQAGGPYAQHLQQPDGWLITNRELFAPRAPGSTCMSALAKFAQTHQHATPQNKINDSKGCGGVMRAAPVAVWSNDPAEVFYAAVGTAALTHSHPSGYLSAGVLSVIVHQLIRDVSLPDSVRLARDLLLRWRDHEEQLRFLDAAVELAKRGPVTPEEIKDTLGQGWVGEEALAIGLYAALATDNLRDALLLSVNHSGDSDSTGIVCGNIAGAIYGTRAIPRDWLATLESRGLVEALARDALAEFSPQPPNDPAWNQRYPAW